MTSGQCTALMILIATAALAIGFVIGQAFGVMETQNLALKKGHAEYILVSRETGETIFHWKELCSQSDGHQLNR